MVTPFISHATAYVLLAVALTMFTFRVMEAGKNYTNTTGVGRSFRSDSENTHIKDTNIINYSRSLAQKDLYILYLYFSKDTSVCISPTLYYQEGNIIGLHVLIH